MHELMHQQRANLVRLMTVASRIKFNGVDFVLEHADHGLCLRISCPNGVDVKTGQPMPWLGRPWPISLDTTNGDLVQTAFKALMTAAEHEIREGFTFQGEAVCDPHRDMPLATDGDVWASTAKAAELRLFG